MPGMDAQALDGSSWSPIRDAPTDAGGQNTAALEGFEGPYSPVRQQYDPPPPLPASVKEEKRIAQEISDAANQTLQEGDAFALISYRWWTQWNSYLGDKEALEASREASSAPAADVEMAEAVGAGKVPNAAGQSGLQNSATRPPPIDNSDIIERVAGASGAAGGDGEVVAGEEGDEWRLRRDLQENHEYALVPIKLWEALHSWYGGGPEVIRRVVRMGQRGGLRVEVYPFTLHLALSTSPLDKRQIILSKRATLQQLLTRACKVFNVHESQVRLWDCFGGYRDKLLTEDLSQALEDAELQMDNEIEVEVSGLPKPVSTMPGQAPLRPEAAAVAAATAGAVAEGEEDDDVDSGSVPPLEDEGVHQLALVPIQEDSSAAGASPHLTLSHHSFAPSLLTPNRSTIAGGPLSHYGPVAGQPAFGSHQANGVMSNGFGHSGPMLQQHQPSGIPGSAAGLSLRSSVLPYSSMDGGEAMGSMYSSRPGLGGPRGLTGLVNLGNTCFMNSALQCLVHTQPLVDYFLGDYSREINRTNPLGMEGELAQSFGELLRKLWAPGAEPVAPRAFKARLSRFAPQFSGYNQHDSQELLAFLLDGLHEDLNRVHKKPYIEAKDADGRPDHVVADEYWSNHKARNNSIIVDTCQGQYKSTLVCPVCSNVSVTFDPFMYLSLPMPTKSTRTLALTVLSSTGSAGPVSLAVTVPKAGTVADLLRSVTVEHRVDANEQLLLAEVYNSKLYRMLAPSEPLNTINDGDKLVAYRVPRGCTNALCVVQRFEDRYGSSYSTPWRSHATPLLLPSPRVQIETGVDLYNLVRRALCPFRLPAGEAEEAAAVARKASAATSLRGEQGATAPAGPAVAGLNGAVGAEGLGPHAVGEPPAAGGPAEMDEDKLEEGALEGEGQHAVVGGAENDMDGAAAGRSDSSGGATAVAGTAAAAVAAAAAGDAGMEVCQGTSTASAAAAAQAIAVGRHGLPSDAEEGLGDSDACAVDDGQGAAAGANMATDAQDKTAVGANIATDAQDKTAAGANMATDTKDKTSVGANGVGSNTLPREEERVSRGFRLRVRRMGVAGLEWVEMPETSDPLPQEFFVAGTFGKDDQAVALDWEHGVLGHLYDVKVLESLPDANAAQSVFWGLPFAGRVGQGTSSGVKAKEGLTLYACLDSFLKEEPLGPDDMWYCPKCKEHRQATKKLDLWRLPDILVVHLKRFSYSRYFKNKLDTFVDFPIKELDLTPYIRNVDEASEDGDDVMAGSSTDGKADAAILDGASRESGGSSLNDVRGSGGTSAASTGEQRSSAGSQDGGEADGSGRRALAQQDDSSDSLGYAGAERHSADRTAKGPADGGLETRKDSSHQPMQPKRKAAPEESPSPRVRPRLLYDLFAVSNHFGGMGGGHYTAYAMHPNDQRWYCFDDSHVAPANESQVKSSAAYVLFYRRRQSDSSTS